MTVESSKKPEVGKGVLHPGARPMNVYVEKGVMYLCDKNIDPRKTLKEQACWTCDEVLFTRGG